MAKNFGTRALAIVLAEAHHAAADRIYFLVEQMDLGKLDTDALTFSKSDPVSLAESALELVRVEPLCHRTGPKPKAQISSAKRCPACRAKDYRGRMENGNRKWVCFSCGHVSGGHGHARRPADELTSPPCPKCGANGYRNWSARIGGKRIQARVCDECGYTPNPSAKREIATHVMRNKAQSVAREQAKAMADAK